TAGQHSSTSGAPALQDVPTPAQPPPPPPPRSLPVSICPSSPAQQGSLNPDEPPVSHSTHVTLPPESHLGDAGHSEGRSAALDVAGGGGGEGQRGRQQDTWLSSSPVGSSRLKKECPAVSRPAVKAYLLQAAPSVLVLHLKRFSPLTPSGRLAKLDTHVDFDMSLDLRPFTPATPPSTEPHPSAAKALQYTLVAVLEHQGEMKRGHYVAYVSRRRREEAAAAGASHYTAPLPASSNGKDEAEERADQRSPVALCNSADAPAGSSHGDSRAGARAWWRVSDENVKAVPESVVLAAQAYVLFYERET
ncbi:hypothetical protein V8C86DRAFT_2517439, partial [Haematococcus lacustris]